MTVEHCPTCGATVRIVSGDEGTAHYEPITDDPKVIETLARVIENRHGTLHGIGNTLREALAEIKRNHEAV